MKQLKIIYEDEDILVCHKPSGMATEGARAYNIDLISAARNYLRRSMKNKAAKIPYIATVHRLDQPVEGVVVLAKNKKAATEISAQIKKRTTEKYYYALCYGNILEDKGHLSDYLVRKEDSLATVISDKERDSFCNDSYITENGEKIRTIGGEPKKAELDFQVVARNEVTTLLRIKLLTGRFHQIRVQLSHYGYPILGEAKYGTEESVNYSNENGIKNICLVSYKFALKHPTTKKRMEFEIIPDNDQIKKLLGESK